MLGELRSFETRMNLLVIFIFLCVAILIGRAFYNSSVIDQTKRNEAVIDSSKSIAIKSFELGYRCAEVGGTYNECIEVERRALWPEK